MREWKRAGAGAGAGAVHVRTYTSHLLRMERKCVGAHVKTLDNWGGEVK